LPDLRKILMRNRGKPGCVGKGELAVIVKPDFVALLASGRTERRVYPADL